MTNAFQRWFKRVYWFVWESQIEREFSSDEIRTAFNAGWRAAMKQKSDADHG